ncbi:protein translocase subunit secE/sec61 gamma [Oscillibacter sp. PC13]|jgi:preprotein translocase subunit SecE|uniref:preprotein translocase subunit SecE n=1 Tax=Oscillibacter sp. PC13 TaxID=1855299 RepID=UPI0008E2C9B1|nr:preprotein translocase subunit SecE [Oscillibacter sp. PC13]SFP55111.1 protein translocase subunit secE/sec61 gamma [Oscillibacter sp. PC13]
MAEEVKKKKNRGAWFREMKSELKKVVWPNRKTVMANTGTVLLCSLCIGACIWIFDFVAVSAVQLILSVFGA